MERSFEASAHSLSGISVFNALDVNARSEVAAHCRGRCYASQQPIVSYKDDTRDIYFIVSGRVRATIYSLRGKEVAFRDLSAGSMFGDLSAIDGQPRCATVVALEETSVLSMSDDAFWMVMMNHPEVARQVIRELAGLIRLLSERIVELSTLDVEHRVCAELLRLADDTLRAGADREDGYDVEIVKPPTHEAIANRINTHREAVTKVMTRLTKSEILAKRPGALVIRDMERLRERVNEVTGS